MSNKTEWGLVEPFGCDDLRFCLGVEWEMFRQKLQLQVPFKGLIHSANTERLIAMCERHQRFVETIALELYSEWTQVIVGGVK